MLRHDRLAPCCAALLAVFTVACSEPLQKVARSPEPRLGSPNARPAMVVDFRADLAAPRHASDGQGRAWIESGGNATVSTPGTWQIVFEAGPLGVATGGAVYLQVSPFWGWDTPQTTRAGGPGFTRVSSPNDELILMPETIDRQLLRVEVLGPALQSGDRIVFDYGIGTMGARADMYAESESRFWIAVDGDGDGVRGLLPDSPSVRVLAGTPERLTVTLTSRAKPGDAGKLTLAILDRYANAGVDFEGQVKLSADSERLGLPSSIELVSTDQGRKTVDFEVPQPGIYRVEAEVRLNGDLVRAESNPLLVAGDASPLYWADLHGHSSYSDGTGTPEDYLEYARGVSALDVIALTDHDHYGLLFLDAHESRWQEIVAATAAYHQPGEFVPLLGFEWTNWIYGHRHVLYFEEHGTVHSSLSAEADTPQELWALLRGQRALTITHHSAGDPVANDWSIPPDPVLEPVAEIMSVHGSSEAADSPQRLRGFLADNSVRSAIERGYRLGFVGSGDSHDGHPGHSHLSPSYGFRPARERAEGRLGTGGLAAIQADELTREAILSAIRERRVYATSGPRIILEVHLAGHAQGAAIPASTLPARALLSVNVLGTTELESIELIRTGQLSRLYEEDKARSFEGGFELEKLVAGEYLYLRVVQVDGGMAWSSPIYIE